MEKLNEFKWRFRTKIYWERNPIGGTSATICIRIFVCENGVENRKKLRNTHRGVLHGCPTVVTSKLMITIIAVDAIHNIHILFYQTVGLFLQNLYFSIYFVCCC